MHSITMFSPSLSNNNKNDISSSSPHYDWSWFLGNPFLYVTGLILAFLWILPSTTYVDEATYIATIHQHFWALGETLIYLIKDQVATLMLPSVVMGIVYRTRKFAKESFHDMFSISMTMFVPAENKQGYLLAVRTLKEVPLKAMLFDEGAMDVLRAAAERSIKDSSESHSGTSTPIVSHEKITVTPNCTPFHFVDTEGTADALMAAARIRSHCAAELSSMFRVFQCLSAMRVGPIVSRKFCWVITYEASDHLFDAPPSFKGVTTSLMALSRLTRTKMDDTVELAAAAQNSTATATVYCYCYQ